MMVSAVFTGLCVDMDFNLNLPRSMTSDKDLSRRCLLSTEFDGAQFTTDVHPQLVANVGGTTASIVIGMDWIRFY